MTVPFPSLTFFRKLFHLFLNKQDFKFSSGHFIAYKVPFALNKVMRRVFASRCTDTTIM